MIFILELDSLMAHVILDLAQVCKGNSNRPFSLSNTWELMHVCKQS